MSLADYIKELDLLGISAEGDQIDRVEEKLQEEVSSNAAREASNYCKCSFTG